jgi:phospholipid/cholesterol/gamma-HCH transport system substrate-binding protein
MKFSIRFVDQIVGTLFILALAMMVFVVFMLGKNQRWFVHDYQYKTYFSSASGISHNMAIQYKGFTIGRVRRITLAEDDNVEVVFYIFQEYGDRVREGSLVELQTSPIGLGGSSFIFYPGKGRQLDEGVVIPEINSVEAKQLLASGLAERTESSDRISGIITHVNSLLASLNDSFGAKDESDRTAIERTVTGINSVVQAFSEYFVPIMENVNTITGQAAAPDGAVMSMLDTSGPVFSNISETLDSISGIIGSVEKTIEVVPAHLPQIVIVLSDLHSTLVEAEKLIVSLTNNPLLKNGVPETIETGPARANPRNLEF